jgi:hypothetical protein
MSIEPTSTDEPQSTTDTRPTEITARGRSDPWAAPDEADAPGNTAAVARSPRQFDPLSLARMCNLVDEANAYCDENDYLD